MPIVPNAPRPGINRVEVIEQGPLKLAIVILELSLAEVVQQSDKGRGLLVPGMVDEGA